MGAGHFLVAYLVGLLPRAYTLSSLDALRSEGALSVQAGCLFCDADFQTEVARGSVTAETLSVFTCVALGASLLSTSSTVRPREGSRTSSSSTSCCRHWVSRSVRRPTRCGGRAQRGPASAPACARPPGASRGHAGGRRRRGLHPSHRAGAGSRGAAPRRGQGGRRRAQHSRNRGGGAGSVDMVLEKMWIYV